VSEDAAAAARRIVAEVLAQAGIHEDDDARPDPSTPSRADATSAPSQGEAASSPAATASSRQSRAGASAEGRAGRSDEGPRASSPPADAAEVRWDDDPGMVARRIVEQVLSSAAGVSAATTDQRPPEPPTTAEAPEPGPATVEGRSSPEGAQPSEQGPPSVPAPAVEARVGHVPAEGLPADDDEAADVDVVAEVPDDASLSAADIVRRIVADVTSSPEHARPATTATPSPRQGAEPSTSEPTHEPTPASAHERTSEPAGESTPEPAAAHELGEDEEEGPPPPPRTEPTRELPLDEAIESEPTREVPVAGERRDTGPGPDAPAGHGALDSEPTREVRLRPDGPDAEPTREVPARDAAVDAESTREVPLRGGEPDPEPTREVPRRRDGAGAAGDAGDGSEGRAQAGTVPGSGDEDQHETLWPEAHDRSRATTGERSGASRTGVAAASGEMDGSRTQVIEGVTSGKHGTEAGISLLDREAEHEPADEDDGGFEAVVPEPAAVGSHWEPLVAPPPEVPGEAQAQPHTLRWLLISVLGAVALAVLLPLTVVALRSLVSLG
jgi:hypothetical protein